MDRKTDWFLTFTGRQFFPCEPRAEDIDILDIAHALSNVCRFGGHCQQFYSVAQHSVHVARMVRPELSLQALLHDAAEAYCGDMVRPLKRNMPEFKAAELVIWRVIAEKFGVPLEMDPEVKHFDDVALMTERRDLVIHTDHEWGIKAEPDKKRIIPWYPEAARERFMDLFREFTR